MLRISTSGGISIERTNQILAWLTNIAIAPLLWYRWLRYGYAFRRIRFSQPTCAIVDPADYHRLRKYEWLAVKGRKSFYAVRHSQIGSSAKYNIVPMHREIIHIRKGRLADHINNNGIDNRRKNLRERQHTHRTQETEAKHESEARQNTKG